MKKTLLLTLIFLLFSASDAYSCSCLKSKIKEGFKNSDLIFIGKVINEEWNTSTEKIANTNKTEEYKRVTYTFLINEFIKGTESIREVEITTSGFEGDCGMSFEVGAEYLIYSYEIDYRTTSNLYLISEKVKPYFTTDLCTRTNYINNVKQRELKKLKRLAKK